MKRVIERIAVDNVPQMIEALKSMTYVTDSETVYVTLNSDSVRLSLVEETLTDGSIVYNIELSEVCK
jgi:hypothetical protein